MGLDAADASREKIDEIQVVVFELAGEYYGADIASVREIIMIPRITHVPRMPDFVEGIINLRGKVIPVIDLAKRFALSGSNRDRRARIVVVEVNSVTVGIIVDSVTEVLRIPASAIEPASSVILGSNAECIEGVAKLDDRLVIMLDMEKVLSRKETESLESAL